MSLDFEWDNRKAAENLRRHRIDFEQAAMVFDDPTAIDVYDDVDSYGEERYRRIGISDNSC